MLHPLFNMNLKHFLLCRNFVALALWAFIPFTDDLTCIAFLKKLHNKDKNPAKTRGKKAILREFLNKYLNLYIVGKHAASVESCQAQSV